MKRTNKMLDRNDDGFGETMKITLKKFSYFNGRVLLTSILRHLLKIKNRNN